MGALPTMLADSGTTAIAAPGALPAVLASAAGIVRLRPSSALQASLGAVPEAVDAEAVRMESLLTP
jgi:hypothetical protein